MRGAWARTRARKKREREREDKMTARNGSAEWHRNVANGAGTVTVGNGVFQGPTPAPPVAACEGQGWHRGATEPLPVIGEADHRLMFDLHRKEIL
jgi:hypothetical protein